MRPMTTPYIQKLLKFERRAGAIRAAKQRGLTYKQLSEKFDISIARAHVIVTGRKTAWKPNANRKRGNGGKP